MTASCSIPDGILREFEQLDLTPYEARVLLALLRLGSANTAQLARNSGVPRTSTYQVLEELNQKGLAQRVPVEGPAVWASPGRDAVFDRLDALQEERLRQHRLRAASLREVLATSFPETPGAAEPWVHVIHGVGQATSLYERLLNGVTRELLVLYAPPYDELPDRLTTTALETLGRGIQACVLYQAPQWDESTAAGFRDAMDVFHRAGAHGRLVDDIPVRTIVADRRVTLFAMHDPALPGIGFPTTLLVEHPGVAALQAAAFEKLWERARALPATF